VSTENSGETPLRNILTLLPQRSALMAGTVGETLRLAAPDSDDETLWRALDAVQLSQLLRTRDGLDTRIGARGEGLSGGEARRLTLARAMLRQPGFLLLDEPTEGLDDGMAMTVLEGLRAFLPQTAIVIAAHRTAEIGFADRTINLN
jgi:ATP-binding cassette subfamily C protein CydC